jgi:hypothetical protein
MDDSYRNATISSKAAAGALSPSRIIAAGFSFDTKSTLTNKLCCYIGRIGDTSLGLNFFVSVSSVFRSLFALYVCSFVALSFLNFTSTGLPHV